MTTPKYENLDTAEKVQRAFAEGRKVEVRSPGFDEWWPAGPFIDDLLRSELANGVEYRAPESQCPAHGGDGVDVANLFWDRLFAAKIRLVLDVDSDDHSNALPLVVGFGSTEGGVDSMLLHAEVDGKPVSLAALPAQLSTDAEGDCVRVPREPTEAMLDAWDKLPPLSMDDFVAQEAALAGKVAGVTCESELKDYLHRRMLRKRYAAMIAAHAAEEPQA